MKKTYTLWREQVGDFAVLTRAAMAKCSYFSVVVRDSQTSHGAMKLLENLREHLVKQEERADWPGTVLYGRTASVFTYRLDPASALVLLQSASAFSSWLEPDRPEDVSFLRADFSLWLASVAHEGDVFLELESQEFLSLAQLAPQLARRLVADATTSN